MVPGDVFIDPRAIYAFSRDLRLRDHAGLAAASRFGAVVPALAIDDALAARLRRSPRRSAYYCAAVAALDRDLRAEGTALALRRGQAGPALIALAREAGAETVVSAHAYDPAAIAAQRDVQAELEEAGLRAVFVHDAPAIDPEEAARDRDDGYRALAPYVAWWRRHAPATEYPRARFASGIPMHAEPLPEAAEFGSQETAPEGVDERSVFARLATFLDGPALQYAIARNVPAAGETARLSAPLSFGLIAARTVVRETMLRVADPFLLVEESLSLALFLRALATRDFFFQLGWFSDAGPDEPLQRKMRDFAFAPDHPALAAWREGRTGFPLVDAGMRELRATGRMHPRVRSIAASFLCFDLGVDWRIGRDAWDRLLVEDEPALASGNWQWAAGVGADLAAYPRIYNPITQARRYDPRGRYIRRHVDELAAVPDARILDPSGEFEAAQLSLPLYEAAYPRPILNHRAAARTFLARYVKTLAESGEGAVPNTIA